MLTVRKPLPIAKPEDFEGVTLMRLRTESIKRIRLVDISVTDTLTTIGGDNGQGKTSLLDSLEWLLQGKTAMQMAPISNGKQEGHILADFGDGEQVKLTVERTLKRVGDDDFTADVAISIPGHVAPSRVQDFLDKLAGEMSFDPMALDRMKGAERYEALRKLVVGFDFAANKLARDQAFRQRTEVNRDLKREQAALEAIQIDQKAPAEHVDEGALTAELTAAGKQNADIQQRQANRLSAADTIKQCRQTAADADAQIASQTASLESARDREVTRIEDQIRVLRRQIETVKTEATTAISAAVARINAARDASLTRATDLQAKIDEAGPLPAPVDTDALADQLSAARITNRQLADWEGQRAREVAHQRESDRLSAESESLTTQITDLDAARQQAIENAQLPVDGLGFGDGYITLKGAPWEQASTADRVDASSSIAMALNPKIKIVLIRDGSNLGTKMRERIRSRAAERGFRVLMEIVDDTGSTNIVIDDGCVSARMSA